MFKKLRRKFTLLVFAISFFTLLVICIAINVTIRINLTSRVYSQAEKYISRSDEIKDDDHDMAGRYLLYVRTDGEYKLKASSHFPSDEDWNQIVLDIQKLNRKEDFYHNVYYMLNDDALVIVDAKSEVDSMNMVLIISSSVSAFALFFISVLAYLLSKYVIRPYEDLYRSQRRFLTDASHELKTPLSVIQADLDILETKSPSNPWVSSAMSQTERMKKLILEMITLNKLEELSSTYPKKRFDVAGILLDVCSNYDSITEEKKVDFRYDIPSSLFIIGNEDLYLKLFSILLDNAFKYIDENGYIHVSVMESHKKVTFCFENSAKEIDEEKLAHCFDRFYTMDESRSKKNSGFGIGLSIAKAIVMEHDGEIKALKVKDSAVRFVVSVKK
jgi:two-component system, OmpR family, sensor histidine kinase CiaH